jgi:hypothetical protein
MNLAITMRKLAKRFSATIEEDETRKTLKPAEGSNLSLPSSHYFPSKPDLRRSLHITNNSHLPHHKEEEVRVLLIRNKGYFEADVEGRCNTNKCKLHTYSPSSFQGLNED